jgi:hypothetical protein
MKMAILVFFHHGSEGRGIFTIDKYGAKFKSLKCSKQTLSLFLQQSTLSTLTTSRKSTDHEDIKLNLGLHVMHTSWHTAHIMATEAVAFLMMAYKKNVKSSEEEDLDELIKDIHSGHREIGILAGCSSTLRVFTEKIK